MAPYIHRNDPAPGALVTAAALLVVLVAAAALLAVPVAAVALVAFS